MKQVKHWCKSYNPKPNANGNCGDCYNYNTELSFCPNNFASTDLVHPPVKARGRKSSRVTGVLK